MAGCATWLCCEGFILGAGYGILCVHLPVEWNRDLIMIIYLPVPGVQFCWRGLVACLSSSSRFLVTRGPLSWAAKPKPYCVTTQCRNNHLFAPTVRHWSRQVGRAESDSKQFRSSMYEVPTRRVHAGQRGSTTSEEDVVYSGGHSDRQKSFIVVRSAHQRLHFGAGSRVLLVVPFCGVAGKRKRACGTEV